MLYNRIQNIHINANINIYFTCCEKRHLNNAITLVKNTYLKKLKQLNGNETIDKNELRYQMSDSVISRDYEEAMRNEEFMNFMHIKLDKRRVARASKTMIYVIWNMWLEKKNAEEHEDYFTYNDLRMMDEQLNEEINYVIMNVSCE